jgi:hypothetical protein
LLLLTLISSFAPWCFILIFWPYYFFKDTNALGCLLLGAIL